MTNWQNWTRSQFVELPKLDYISPDKVWWRSLVFFPTRSMHAAGYTNFAIIGINEDGPAGLIHKYDVLNLWTMRGEESYLNIDCLWPSGVFHLWSYDGEISWDYGRIRTRVTTKTHV